MDDWLQNPYMLICFKLIAMRQKQTNDALNRLEEELRKENRFFPRNKILEKIDGLVEAPHRILQPGTTYLATVEGEQPRVRPFGTAHIFEGKLYIQTGKVKDVSKQIHANPKVEICAFKNGEWLRVAGELVEDDRRKARQSMLDAYPSLRQMYSADDGNTEVFYFKNATATFSSFTYEPEVVKF